MYPNSRENKHNTHPNHIPTEISRKSGCHTAQDTVVRITEQTAGGLFTPHVFPVLPVRIVMQVFRFSHTGNHGFHILNRNHLLPLADIFSKKLCNARFHVAHNLLRTIVFTEMITQVVQVIVQQHIGILVYMINATRQINSQCLFHYSTVKNFCRK